MFASIRAKSEARRAARARKRALVTALQCAGAAGAILAIAVPFLALLGAYGHYAATFIY